MARLLEMGLEPYRITSAMYGVLAQRLLRRLNTDDSPERYHGRIPVAEFVPMTALLRAAVLTGADASELQQIAAKEDDYSSLRDSADSLVAQQLTDFAEVRRVLGETA